MQLTSWCQWHCSLSGRHDSCAVWFLSVAALTEEVHEGIMVLFACNLHPIRLGARQRLQGWWSQRTKSTRFRRHGTVAEPLADNELLFQNKAIGNDGLYLARSQEFGER